MLKHFISCSLALFILSSCSQGLNQYKKDSKGISYRSGKWKEIYSSNDGDLTAIGRYKEGKKIGVWKTYFQENLYQKEQINRSFTKVKFYYPNGKIMQKGQTKLDHSNAESHWYYYGAWKFYDAKGKLSYIKHYISGRVTDSIYVGKK